MLPTLAVIVAVPAPTAFTVPPDTVATFELLVVQVTALLSVVLLGLYVTVKSLVFPCTNDNFVVFKLILCSGAVTVTTHVAVLVPTFAFIVAVPGPTAFTIPFVTVATFESVVVHCTVLLSVVLLGLYVTVKLLVSP